MLFYLKYIKFKNIQKPFYVGPNGEEYAWYQCTVSLFYLYLYVISAAGYICNTRRELQSSSLQFFSQWLS